MTYPINVQQKTVIVAVFSFYGKMATNIEAVRLNDSWHEKTVTLAHDNDYIVVAWLHVALRLTPAF